MNKLIVFILVSTLFSCEKICSVTSIFCKDKTPKTEIIDFSQVDQFPQFKDCDAMLNFKESKACFEASVHSKINERIQLLQLKTEQNITDTLQIQFTIDKTGSFSCNKISTSNSLQLLFPNLSTEIQEIISDLSPINPAQKRGIPVSSTYIFPLVINTK